MGARLAERVVSIERLLGSTAHVSSLETWRKCCEADGYQKLPVTVHWSNKHRLRFQPHVPNFPDAPLDLILQG